MNISADIANAIGCQHDDPKLSSLQNAIIHITMSIAQSGIVNMAYIRWLDQIQSDKLIHAYQEVEEAYLMMQEIIYHIDKLKRQLKLYLEKNLLDNRAQTLSGGLSQLDNISLPQVDQNLAKIWMFNI